MDKTPIPYSYHSNKTLDMKGKKTIHARALRMDTMHVTLADTVTASGKVLSPFLIFKGKPSGCIAMREFSNYPNAGKYAWIDVVLKPWKDDRDSNNQSPEPPIIILDAYCIHQMGSVVN
jgi:hypothetical protein